jgi:hypothetical protein
MLHQLAESDTSCMRANRDAVLRADEVKAGVR